jgi:DNA-binding NarL/FixJ family response regulator
VRAAPPPPLQIALVDPRRQLRGLVVELNQRRLAVRAVVSEPRIVRTVVADGELDAAVVAGPGRRVPGALAELRGICPSLPVVVCGESPARDELLDALRAGASGYVVLGRVDELPEELALAVRAASSGGIYITPRVVGHLVREVQESPAGRSFEALAASMEVTRRERQVLELMASGLTYREAGERLCISGTTVKTHVQSALRKLGLRNRIEAVQWLMRQHAA